MLPTFAPNLAWRNEPLRAAVEQRTGLPVVVENDADAAAWGETRSAAGNGHPDAITGPMVTMGAVAGDPVTLESFKAVGAWLGHGMAEPGRHPRPAGLHRRRRRLRSRRAPHRPRPGHLPVHPHRPRPPPHRAVRVAQLGQDAGLIGAADLSRR